MKRIKRLKVYAVLLSSIGAVLITAGIIVQLVTSKGGYIGTVFTDITEYDIPRELVVITTDMPITVTYADTERVMVRCVGSQPLIVSEEKGMLKLTQDAGFNMTLFSPRAQSSGVTVYLPHKVYERISLSSSSGSVEADSLGADTLEFGTKVGDMRLYGIDERAAIRTESGDIYAEFSSFNGDMTIYAGAGDVTLLMPDELSVYLEYYTSGGRFTSERFDEHYYGRYGDAAVIYNGAENYLNVRTTSGNLFIN